MVNKLEIACIFEVCCGRQTRHNSYLWVSLSLTRFSQPVRFSEVCCGRQARTSSYLLGFVVVNKLEPIRIFVFFVFCFFFVVNKFDWGLLWSTTSTQFVFLGFIVADKV